MNILSIETSCDETSAAIVSGRRVLAQTIYSQVLLHSKWGGVVPSLARKAHEERIDEVIEKTCRQYNGRTGAAPRERSAAVAHALRTIDAVAVTVGPGLAIALGVGIDRATQLARTYEKPIIAVNHVDAHLYSVYVQNSMGNPMRDYQFPALGFVISGGHTELVLWKDHGSYELLGATIDDAAGEALDKAGKLLGLGYPAGPVIEQLAKEVGNTDPYSFPRPLHTKGDLRFSFSGLKTAFYYRVKDLEKAYLIRHVRELASSFQEAVFESLCMKLDWALKQTRARTVVVGGGVIANTYLRTKIRRVVRQSSARVFFPSSAYLTGDNAAMIGVTAHEMATKGGYADVNTIDRIARLHVGSLKWS